jgi:hypothetical protein
VQRANLGFGRPARRREPGRVAGVNWARQCEAAWARSTDGIDIKIQGSTTSDGSHIVSEYQQVDGDPGAGTEWTDMISFTLWTRACIEGIDSTDWNCTGWH